MSSTLTNLLPLLYAARDKVSREQVGMIPSVMIDAKAETAALNQVINVPVVPAATAYDITPGDVPSDNGNVTPDNVTMSITKSRQSPVRWEGEEEKQVMTTGIFSDVHVDRVAQAMRVLTNEIETDLATEGYNNTSGGFGTVATVPFGSDLTDSAYILKTLKDRGGHHGDTSLVFDTTVGANFLSLTGMTNVNEAGTSSVRDQGIFLKTHGMALRESGQIQSHTAGAGINYTSAATGYAVGTTSIPIITGTGTVLLDDMVSFAGDDNQYTVVTGVGAPGTIVIAEPGLLQALPAVATAMTITASHVANLCFDRNAIALLSRAPAMPSGGDAADDVISIVDPIGGITYQVALYRQYRRVKMEIAAAWGVKAIAPRHISRLLY